jgi:hypothetical protein
MRLRHVEALVPTADRQAAHRPLTGYRNALWSGFRQGAQQHIHQTLAALYIAARDRGGRPRVDARAFRRDDRNGVHRASGCGRIVTQQTTEDVVAGRVRNGVDRIDAPAPL